MHILKRTVLPRSIIIIILTAGTGPGFSDEISEKPIHSDPIKQFRRDIANPAKYHIRKGNTIDINKLKSYSTDFMEKHQDLLRKKFNESIASIKPGQLPNLKEYRKIGSKDCSKIRDYTENILPLSAGNPDVKYLGMTMISMVLPEITSINLNLPVHNIAEWLFFIHYALPQWRNCGTRGNDLIITADYGGVDLFVFTYTQVKACWIPASFEWWRKK